MTSGIDKGRRMTTLNEAVKAITCRILQDRQTEQEQQRSQRMRQALASIDTAALQAQAKQIIADFTGGRHDDQDRAN